MFLFEKRKIEDLSPFVGMYLIGEKDSYKVEKRKAGLFLRLYKQKYLTAIPSDLKEASDVVNDKFIGVSFEEEYCNIFLSVERKGFSPVVSKILDRILQNVKLVAPDDFVFQADPFFKYFVAFLAKEGVIEEYFRSIDMQGKHVTFLKYILQKEPYIIDKSLTWAHAINIPQGWDILNEEFHESCLTKAF